MKDNLSLGTIYKLGKELVVVIGVSQALHLVKMRDIGCMTLPDFKRLKIESQDNGIQRKTVFAFRNSKGEIYHNTVATKENLVIYKSLEDSDGAKCLKQSTFETMLDLKSQQDVSILGKDVKNFKEETLDPVFSDEM